MPSPPTIYRAAVIGAGPSGLASLGNLLDRFTAASDRILWIDPQFKAGRLDSYPAVPSNTKVCLFTKFARECRSFDAEKSSPILKSLTEQFDPQSGCELKWAAELCRDLTGHLLQHEQVHSVKGLVNVLRRSDNIWTIKVDNGESFQSDLVFLTTGSKPKNLTINNAPPVIHLDVALNPALLNNKISQSDTVAVYGSSHSAMLVLKNLLAIPNSPKFILNYYRQPAKFAEFPDPVNCPDRILHDNTGLKGETAQWVRSWIDLPLEDFDKMFQGKLKRIQTNGDSGIGNEADFNIYAVGYERNPLPTIYYKNEKSNKNERSNKNGTEPAAETEPETETETTTETEIDYTSTGQLIINNHILEGLYGYGIAFPERVKDLDGSDELAVGLWKFMRHIKKCITSMAI